MKEPLTFKEPLILDDTEENADWIKMDLIDQGIDTRQKFVLFLSQHHWSLEQYKKTNEFKAALEVYPYLKEM